jgi:hypothetical protein
VFRTSWVHPQGDICLCSIVYFTCIGVSSLMYKRVSNTDIENMPSKYQQNAPLQTLTSGCPIMFHNHRISKLVSLNAHCHLATQNCHTSVILAMVHFAPRLPNITILVSFARVPAPLSSIPPSIHTDISTYNSPGNTALCEIQCL